MKEMKKMLCADILDHHKNSLIKIPTTGSVFVFWSQFRTPHFGHKDSSDQCQKMRTAVEKTTLRKMYPSLFKPKSIVRYKYLMVPCFAAAVF